MFFVNLAFTMTGSLNVTYVKRRSLRRVTWSNILGLTQGRNLLIARFANKNLRLHHSVNHTCEDTLVSSYIRLIIFVKLYIKVTFLAVFPFYTSTFACKQNRRDYNKVHLNLLILVKDKSLSFPKCSQRIPKI